MISPGSNDALDCDAAGGVAVPDGVSSYPGGELGAGIYQRLINLIPRHRILIVAFAGHCGVTRNIRPAEHAIVIDADADVRIWWDSWRRTPAGRDLEIHHCDSIEWLRYRFGLTEYSAAGARDARAGGEDRAAVGRDATRCDSRGCRCREGQRLVMADASARGPAASRRAAASDGAAVPGGGVLARTAGTVDRLPHRDAAEAFVLCDPPYVLSERAHGRQYAFELSDEDHRRLLRILTAIPVALASILVCGYACPLYAALDPWRSIDHRVPTRGGLQDERIWMNYPRPEQLHDYRYIGNCRRSRARIRRRQKNWASQVAAMSDREREAMLEALKNPT